MGDRFDTLADAAAFFRAWLAQAALPLWAGRGVDARTGAFEEALRQDGAPHPAPRRARVQARQAFVFASAAGAGYGADWLAVARRGWDHFAAHYRRPDGLFARLADADGEILDAGPTLYDQDFALLAMAALAAVEPGGGLPAAAADVRRALEAHRHPAGGFREAPPHPFQANAHMHLFESALAWEPLGDPAWAKLADEIAALALARFVDADGGFLREYFGPDWRPAAGADGRLVEPGHQFEWAWLLERWARRRGEAAGRDAARRLFAAGLSGVDPARGCAVNALSDDLAVSDASARLWPQTEYLKAALILGEDAHALAAAAALARYLDTPVRGLWRDVWRPDGTFVEEPAPASSFYHIVVAVLELERCAAA